MSQTCRTPLLIVSFHRSGSSLTAHMFSAAGLHLGDKLLGAKPSNPYGHFEDTSVISIHDKFLKMQGHAWYCDRGALASHNPMLLDWIKRYAARKYTQHQAFGVKDPRLCLTIRYWQAALGRVNVVFVHRDADLCRTSLWSRALKDLKAGQAQALNAELVKNPDHIGRMYGHNVASLLSFYDSLGPDPNNVIFASYDDLISGKRNLVSECKDRWNYALNDVDIDDFYDPTAVTAHTYGVVSLRDAQLATQLQHLNDRLTELSAA